MARNLSLSQARRVALAAQGLHRARPTAPVTIGAVGRTFNKLKLLQVDSVNVLTRAQYLPIFSRLGPYDPELLDSLSVRKPRQVIEYWAHEASLIKAEYFADLIPWQRRRWVGSSQDLDQSARELSERIYGLLLHREPLSARDISDALGHDQAKDTSHWGWNWSAVKRILEAMFADGIIGTEGRNKQFERLYTIHEHVGQQARRTELNVDPIQAMERLLLASVDAHGIGSAHCLADYFRLPIKQSTVVLTDLVDRSILETITIEGLKEKFFLHPGTKIPRTTSGRALLSPFDSLVFNRKRIEKLFNFSYRLEIYTPSEKRVFGYYVLPFLLGERLVARVDVKADRESRTLLVRGAYAEPHAPVETAQELASELRLMASWLNLDKVLILPRGNLAAGLEFSLSSPKLADNHK
ncbi:hypothetical protein CQ018_00940 [Arthrobacter sp. MYb227]|uniref:winged helix-turn-helix domain-containing protein n=1 Tax=Arthrobacter sp. MYb227 TaxID=1848601 RepID=UPI000CFBE2EB|nr:crosslink repair DNA glycosylase YcaQ family protein [Arthrobacter sp. MYb227]PQZ95896.1 hypothetical protein CQ018_00940 [Arthrobacter sp. MYb227]